jgi:hypothetical protein
MAAPAVGVVAAPAVAAAAHAPALPPPPALPPAPPLPPPLDEALTLVVAGCLAQELPIRGALEMLGEIVARAAVALDEVAAGAAAEAVKGLRLRAASAALRERTGGGEAVRGFLLAAGFAPAAGELLAVGEGSRAALAAAAAAVRAALE